MDKKNNQYVICPVCSGSGKTSLGLACSHCSGAGAGVFYYDRFYYFGQRFGRASIALKHIRDKAHLAVNFLSFCIGFFGLLSLGFWVYQATIDGRQSEIFLFWRSRHILILIFWVSLLFDMFMIYRLSEQARKRHLIKFPKYKVKKLAKRTIPEDWDSLRLASDKNKIDVYSGFNLEAEEAIEKAYLLAVKLGHSQVTPLHLFMVALSDRQVAAIFSRLNVSIGQLLEKIKVCLRKIPEGKGHTVFSLDTKEIFIDAYLQAMDMEEKKVTVKNFLIPILSKEKYISELLLELEITEDKILNTVLWFVINEKQLENYRQYSRMARYKPGTNMDKAYTAVATVVLNHFGYDLTLAAKWGRLEFCVARDKELEQIFQNFESGANGVILTGPNGVGKNLLINGIAQMMVKENVPKMFQDKRLVELDASRLIAGADASQAEERLLAIVDEIVRSGNIILYVANINSLIGISSGGAGSLDLSEVLVSALVHQNVYCLASSNEENYASFIEGKPIDESFVRVKIEEPVGNQAIQIVESKVSSMEAAYKVFFSYNAIEESITLSQKYIHDKFLPEKAIRILELSATKAAKSRGEQTIVAREDVAAVISEQTGIPVTSLTQAEAEKLLNLEDRIHELMINQDEAVKMVSSSLRRARTNVREEKRPIANFLFLGPTGVGKTKLAKVVAEIYFGSEGNMVRLDMSEYQAQESLSKMIGDVHGVHGYLTEAVRKAPFSLVLLDEIEKAHPDILNVFLQVMADGRLTDGQGRTIDFTNSIIIGTSNIGALFIQEEIFKGTAVETIQSELIDNHLNQVMRPELVNRFDGVIVFEPLSQEHVVEIARLMLKKTGEALMKKGISLEVEESGLRILAKAGYDPKFGARPMRRLLQAKVDDRIASLILRGELKRRDTVVIGAEAEVSVEKGMSL